MTTIIDESAVRARLAANGFNGIVALIDYLAQRRSEGCEICWIGSGTIFGSESQRPTSPEQIMGLASWSLGSRRGSKLPIEDIANFSDKMLRATLRDGRPLLDTLCKDFSCSVPEGLQAMLTKAEIVTQLPKRN